MCQLVVLRVAGYEGGARQLAPAQLSLASLRVGCETSCCALLTNALLVKVQELEQVAAVSQTCTANSPTCPSSNPTDQKLSAAQFTGQ